MTAAAPLSAWLDRLALALLTESSGGFIYANDGAAYGPGTHPEIPEETRSRVFAVLRESLNIPHDRVGRDGRSTGTLQQISFEASRARYPGLPGGWETMRNTMNPVKAALAFIQQLKVTNDSVFINTAGQPVETGDPIVADVLRTQQPAVGSVLPPNYRPAQVALAKRIARGGSRFFTDGGK